MNAKTRQLQGLRAAQNMVKLVREISRSGALKIGSCEIDLDNGEKHRLCLRDYVQMALDALDNSIEQMKAAEALPRAGLN